MIERPKYENYEIDYGKYGVGEEEEEGDGAGARWIMWAIMGMGTTKSGRC
jgi:hypothetical protein